MSILEIKNLSVDLDLANGTLHALRDISFSLDPGESLGIVGESGSGKTMTAMALMRLLPKTAVTRASAIRFEGVDLQAMSDKDFLNSIAGVKMSMIFQEPMTALNPVYTIRRQLTETVLLRKKKSSREALERAVFLLEKAGIPNAESRLNQYPHQLSGGQRQRVMIAMALMNEPQLIIADEPTTALDVTVQAQILQLLVALGKELGMAMILITHDLGVISRTVDKVAVMYAGQLVETGTTNEVFNFAKHPYTKGLLDAVPRPGRNKRLSFVPGMIPDLVDPPEGCRFHPRCSARMDICSQKRPGKYTLGENHDVECFLYEDHSRG